MEGPNRYMAPAGGIQSLGRSTSHCNISGVSRACDLEHETTPSKVVDKLFQLKSSQIRRKHFFW